MSKRIRRGKLWYRVWGLRDFPSSGASGVSHTAKSCRADRWVRDYVDIEPFFSLCTQRQHVNTSVSLFPVSAPRSASSRCQLLYTAAVSSETNSAVPQQLRSQFKLILKIHFSKLLSFCYSKANRISTPMAYLIVEVDFRLKPGKKKKKPRRASHCGHYK